MLNLPARYVFHRAERNVKSRTFVSISCQAETIAAVAYALAKNIFQRIDPSQWRVYTCRCAGTLLHRIFVEHRDVIYLSLNVYLRKVRLVYVQRLYGLRGHPSVCERLILVIPEEAAARTL
jgi:hypothetical protein